MNQLLYERGMEIVQNAPQLYLDLDVEADGKAGYGSLLSVGAVSPWGEEFYAELKPTSDVWVQSQRDFAEAHGLERERLIREGKEPAEVMLDLVRWASSLKKKYQKLGCVITAFNASFDFAWVDLEITKANLKSPFGVAGYCIKSRAQGLEDGYDWRDTSKGRLPDSIVPDGDFTHNALEDAIYQQKVHFALAGLIEMIRVEK